MSASIAETRESIHGLILRRRALKAGLRHELAELVRFQQQCNVAVMRRNALRQHIDEMLRDLHNGASLALVNLAKSVDPADAFSISMADHPSADVVQRPETIRAICAGRMASPLQLKEVRLRLSTPAF